MLNSVRGACHGRDVVHNGGVVPVSWELGLAWYAGPVAVAAPGRIAVEDVRGAFGIDMECVRRRAPPLVHRITAGTRGRGVR